MESTPIINGKDIAILSDFNKKFNTELSLDNPDIIVFSRKIGNEGLKILCLINFNSAEKLILEENNISDINILKSNNFGNSLTALDLSSNQIISIDVLSILNFPLLNYLYLNNNKIQNIDILCQVNLPNLTELNLSSNKINSIEILIKTNFPLLNDLNLSNNEICSIDILSEVKFPELKSLVLNNNKIKSIDVFIRVDFPKLKELKLEKNNLFSIDLIDKVFLPKLKYLSIGDDSLGDRIDNLKEIAFPSLKNIDIYLNEKIINNSEKKILEIQGHFLSVGVNFGFVGNKEIGEEGGYNNDLDMALDNLEEELDDNKNDKENNNINIDFNKDEKDKNVIHEGNDGEKFFNENLMDFLMEDNDDEI